MIRIANPAALGAALRDLRILHQLTQRQLSEVTDIPKEMLGAYERGVNVPGPGNLLKIINAYGYDLALIPRRTA